MDDNRTSDDSGLTSDGLTSDDTTSEAQKRLQLLTGGHPQNRSIDGAAAMVLMTKSTSAAIGSPRSSRKQAGTGEILKIVIYSNFSSFLP
ncbi:hypothetical protein L596_011569 [Steinernema carpocapsae]|uniref:Uncharacterized protein n=1 Tax=Steinernema carpocapsae TaxID=34508 RepID=A0A4U5NV35_STECR|nr:hypothetical protein L596_011569 [Steinernema carpocapsae]